MFSPVKKELPTHLPLPPSGVVISASDKYKRPPSSSGPSSGLVSLPQMGSARTMNEIIEKEIERNLSNNEQNQRRGVPSASAMSPQKLNRPSMTASASTMSRLVFQHFYDIFFWHIFLTASETEGPNSNYVVSVVQIVPFHLLVFDIF